MQMEMMQLVLTLTCLQQKKLVLQLVLREKLSKVLSFLIATSHPVLKKNMYPARRDLIILVVTINYCILVKINATAVNKIDCRYPTKVY